jgi:thioredoxin 1
MAKLQAFNETVLGRPGKVLVKFGAPWCGPCQQVGPVLEQMKDEGYTNIYDVNTDADQESAIKYGIRSVPTIIVFENGVEVKREMGAKSKSQIVELLEGE